MIFKSDRMNVTKKDFIKGENKMKKLLILALALIFAVFSCLLVACDDETESSSSESEQESQSQSETESEADDSNNDVVASEGLSFELDSTTDTYTVVGIGSWKDANLVIPSTYNGKRVTSIGDEAFRSCTSITSVTILDRYRGVRWLRIAYSDKLRGGKSA